MGTRNFLNRRRSCFHYEFAIQTRLLFTLTFQDLITLPIFTTLKLTAVSNENINYQVYAASVIMNGVLPERYLHRKAEVLKTSPGATLSTTYPKWTGLGLKASLRGE
jgi:hypothetical protein